MDSWTDEAVVQVARARSSLGAIQSRFNYTIDNLDVQAQNLEEARSLIADVDVAKASADLAKNQVLQEAGMAVLAQATAQPRKALALIN